MKNTLLLIAFIFVSFTMHAQNTTSGVRVAYNISNLDFEPDATFDNTHRNGLAIGAFLDYAFSEKMSIMPELMYSAEGGKEKELRANYIQMPITLRFHFGKMSVGVGPQANLKIWSYEDGYRNFIFSAVGGAQYDISDNFFIDARFNYGFSNIYDDEVGVEAKNSTIQLGIGLKI
ncbi:porin family protein [Lacinutrix iliipiscaria]|uniref:Porin family protein n=1 Tax=Lacinutrix iliipiscaria TaxID=1230532 RepID=A0ABW5WQI2_9FLAO